ncbi:hypothetical protein PRVXT_001233 [Proteinivorax tanatarense]|uniref:ABC-2 type transport system permease protein n=1 Tax=Proteinivorax tanatarense TaxID=1260629 RepID=A0AAU7VPS1_9FIRM
MKEIIKMWIYKLIIKEKLYSFKNVIRILLVRYPFQLTLGLVALAFVFYATYQIINNFYGGLMATDDSSIILFIYFLKREFILLFGISSLSILILTDKSVKIYWQINKQLPIRPDTVYFAHLTLYFTLLSLPSLLLITICASILKVSVIKTLVLLLFYVAITLGYIFLCFSISKLISSKTTDKQCYFIACVITVVTLSIGFYYYLDNLSLNSILKGNNFLSYIILLSPNILGILLMYTLRKADISLVENKRYLYQYAGAPKILKKIENIYLRILVLEVKRNWKVYGAFISIPVTLGAINTFFLQHPDYSLVFFTLASTGTVSIGFYNSYIESFKILPLKEEVNLLLRWVFMVFLISLLYILLSLTFANYMLISDYIEIILLSTIFFIICYLTKIPLIKNGKENDKFCSLGVFGPLVYKFFFESLNMIYSMIFSSEINYIYFCSLVTSGLVVLVFFELKDKNDTKYLSS